MPTGDVPKRHHFVPETYLRAWCDADGRVAVRRRDQDQTFLTNPVDVGVETRLYGDGIEGLWREKNFKLVEDEWPRLRNDLVQRGHLHGNDRDLASTFMALQIARTHERIAHNAFTSELLEFTDERPLTHDAVRRFITERHGHTPEEPEVEAAWTLATYEMQESVPSFETVFSISMENATIRMAPLLSGLHWRVETVDAPILWTCDRPLMPWRPPSVRDRYEGLGYANADEVRMPLSPVAMLILQRQASVRVLCRSISAVFTTTTTTSHCSATSSSFACPGTRAAEQREDHSQPPGRSLPHWSWGRRRRRRYSRADG